MLQSRDKNRGFTLVELMLAMAISGIVAMAALTVFRTANWSASTQEQLAEAQQNARAGMEQMAKDIRAAGFGLPDPPFSLVIGGLTVTSPVAVATGGPSAPDTLTVAGLGYPVATLTAAVAGVCNESGSSTLCVSDVSRFETASGTLFAERRFITLDGNKFLEVNGVDSGNKRLSLNAPLTLDRGYSAGTQVYIIQAVQYSISTDQPDQGCSAATPCLVSRDFTQLRGNGRWVVAQDIEDIQFAYSLMGGAAMVGNGSSSSIDIASLRVNVVARPRTPDAELRGSSARPALEDRSAGTADNYRRRVLTSVVKIRNPRYAL